MTLLLLATPGVAMAQDAPPAATQPAPETIELNGDRWRRVAPTPPAQEEAAAGPSTTQPLAEAGPDSGEIPLFTDARRLIEADQGDEAFDALVEWLKVNETHPRRDEGLFLAATALFHDHQGVKAFYYLDELLDTYPSSSWYPRALRFQYRIADWFLKGGKERFLGLLIAGRRTQALEMLYRIQQRAPGSPVAERALLRSADHFYDRGDYDFAEDAYSVFINSYSRSPRAPYARLRQALSNLFQFVGPRYDPTPLIDARTQLLTFSADYPELAQRQELPKVLQWIDGQLATKLRERAEWYARTHQPGAALEVYRDLLERYPNYHKAASVRERIERLEKVVAEQGEENRRIVPITPAEGIR